MEHKDIPVLNYSQKTAQSLGTEKEWLLSCNENKACAGEIIHQVQRSYGDYSAALAAVLDKHQYPEERVRNILVNEVFPDQMTVDYYESNGEHIYHDISDKTAKWAIEAIAKQDEWDETVFKTAPRISDSLSVKAVDSIIRSFESRVNELAEHRVLSKLKPLAKQNSEYQER